MKRSQINIYIGCAGWSIPKVYAGSFPEQGSHLERYAQRFPAVEINSSYYRPHRPATYARWASATPPGFRFAVKVPRTLTHAGRLREISGLDRFLEEAGSLGEKLGPLLVQLPPSLPFAAGVAAEFFAALRQRYAGYVVCEPRHATWFSPAAESLLADFHVARVAADPARHPLAGEPGGWDRLVYYRLHGSPEMYTSPYPPQVLESLAVTLWELSSLVQQVWCIFDNTAQGAATHNALALLELVREA